MKHSGMEGLSDLVRNKGVKRLRGMQLKPMKRSASAYYIWACSIILHVELMM